MMGVALGLLGWTPDTFWRATPAELAAALEARAGEQHGSPHQAAAPPQRTDLDALLQRFPDPAGAIRQP